MFSLRTCSISHAYYIEPWKCSFKYGQDLQHRITWGASKLNGNMGAGGGLGRYSEQCHVSNGDDFDVFCLKQSCLDSVVSPPALKKQGKVGNGRKWSGEEQGGRREGASTHQRKVGKPGGSTWNFHPPSLAASLSCHLQPDFLSHLSPLLSNASLLSPLFFVLRNTFHKPLQSCSCSPSDFSLKISFCLGLQNSCGLSGLWGWTCSHVCMEGTGSLLGMKMMVFILGALSAIALCICMLSELYICTVNTCVHRQCYKAPLQHLSENLSGHQHTAVLLKANNYNGFLSLVKQLRSPMLL